MLAEEYADIGWSGLWKLTADDSSRVKCIYENILVKNKILISARNIHIFSLIVIFRVPLDGKLPSSIQSKKNFAIFNCGKRPKSVNKKFNK